MGAPNSNSQYGASNGGGDDDLNKPPAAQQHAVSNDSSNSSATTYLALIQQYLSVLMIDNAIFLAERCVAEHPTNQEAIYLLALCYYRAQRPKAARQTIERYANNYYCTTTSTTKPAATTATTTSSSSSSAWSSMQYLSAKCSFDLKDYKKAEDALLKETHALYRQSLRSSSLDPSAPPPTMDEWILSTTPCPIPNGAAGVALLADICRQSNRHQQAANYYEMSLKLDPFLWTSFEALAEMGVHHVPASQAFGIHNTTTTAMDGAAAAASGMRDSSTLMAHKTPLQPVASTPLGPLNQTSQSFFNPSASAFRHRSVQVETPGLTPIPLQAEVTPKVGGGGGSSRLSTGATIDNPVVVRRAREIATRQYYPPSPETPITNVTRSMRYLRGIGAAGGSTAAGGSDAATVGGNTHRSSSHHHQQQYGTATASENQVANNRDGGVPSTLLSMNQSIATETIPEDLGKPDNKEEENEHVQEVLELLATAGSAYQCICQYKCKDALQWLRLLPRAQQITGWALHQQGRAYLDMNDFSSAQRCLEFMQIQDPARLKGLEILSTVYWQLKKEVELAHLAQRAVDWDRLSPEAWCVVGNCFSLQKDHETALVFFGRSLQLDPDFTYTHTLSGYEYMANEDFDKAMACFRQALRTDERHYNAWYGLGAIYHRQEKFDLAEYHFERAVAIHPSSSVLRCNLGIAQYANGKAYQALETLQEAFRLDPHNPQARFQRATIFSALHRPEEALIELQKVRDAAPREATVHFAMGKVLKRLGRPEQAMKCFLTAMDLDPKENQLVKSAMDKLDEPEVDEETMAAF